MTKIHTGSIKVKVENSQISGVFINAELGDTYKRIFISAGKKLKKTKKIEPGLQVIVFGSFWIEACCNNELRFVLENGLKKEDEKLSRLFWEDLKRSSVYSKFNMFCLLLLNSGGKKILKEYESIFGFLKTVMELRNRLAHFKDSDEKIAVGPISDEELIKIIGNQGNPALIDEFLVPKSVETFKRIKSIKGWLDKFHRIMAKGFRIKSFHKKVKRKKTGQ